MVRKAFTLIELLVVISIIALLLAILMPALTKAREQANHVRCATNMKNIYYACYMYTSDNEENFPHPRVCFYAQPDPGNVAAGFPADWNGAGNPQEVPWHGSSGANHLRWCNPHVDLSKYPKLGGAIFSYLKSPEVLVCPTFLGMVRRLASQLVVYDSGGQTLSQLGDYHFNYTLSMNAYLGTNDVYCKRKLTNIRRPTETFIFAEENPRSVELAPGIWTGAPLNDTYLVTIWPGDAHTYLQSPSVTYLDLKPQNGYGLVDAIGGFHLMVNGDLTTGKANCIFADGHIAAHETGDSFVLCWPNKK